MSENKPKKRGRKPKSNITINENPIFDTNQKVDNLIVCLKNKKNEDIHLEEEIPGYIKENYEVSRGSFKVQESHIELNRIFLNEEKLKKLSTPSNGTFKRWLNKEDLIDTIEDIQKSKSYIAVIAFRYNYIYICFIILLLSLEWFYRRKIGLS